MFSIVLCGILICKLIVVLMHCNSYGPLPLTIMGRHDVIQQYLNEYLVSIVDFRFDILTKIPVCFQNIIQMQISWSIILLYSCSKDLFLFQQYIYCSTQPIKSSIPKKEQFIICSKTKISTVDLCAFWISILIFFQ